MNYARHSPPPSSENLRLKWRTLSLLSLAALLILAVWFSTTAVLPALSRDWALNSSQQAWLTMAVQIGFVAGAMGSALLNLADRIPARRMFAGAAILAGISTALIPLLANGFSTALALRFLTGVFLAGVYPVGMKIVATWTLKDRGLGIGLLIGALAVGSASPHLINALGGVAQWRPVVFLAAGSALLGALIGHLWVREGPFRTKTPPFNWRYVNQILHQRDLLLANVGYLGHMWELYAMWAWITAFLLASFRTQGLDPAWASLTAFAIIAAGGLGSLVAGKLADRNGRTLTTILSMAISGSCAILIGHFFGGDPLWVVGIGLVWGFSIVADSAQFSACVSELCSQDYIGTALTLQTSLGFLLTLVSIRLVPVLVGLVGWEWAFTFLALGPAIGIGAMWALRRSPKAIMLANGNR